MAQDPVRTHRIILAAAALAAASVLAAAPARAAVTCSAPASDGTVACPIDASLNPAALCNDGSIPKFSVRPGKSAHWVIWLQGGDYCIDQTSCSARDPSLLTGTTFKASKGQGILSASKTVNPALHDANAVRVHYCSSDRWSGARPPKSSLPFDQNDTDTWSFQGRAIALAAVATLSELNLNFQGATQIVLGGGSAGGQGITFTTNDIIPTLPAGATVLLAIDAGFWQDIGQFDSAAPPNYSYQGHPNAVESFAQQETAFWNGRGDAKCLEAGYDISLCYNTSFILQNRFITVSTFADEAQMDIPQLAFELCPTDYDNDCPTLNAKQKAAYTSYFASGMAAALTGAGTQAAYWAYSPDAHIHEQMDNDANFQKEHSFPTGMETPSQALADWYANYLVENRKVLIGNGP